MKRMTWIKKACGREAGTIEIESDETQVAVLEKAGLVEVADEPEPVEDRSMAGPVANRAMTGKKN